MKNAGLGFLIYTFVFNFRREIKYVPVDPFRSKSSNEKYPKSRIHKSPGRNVSKHFVPNVLSLFFQDPLGN